MLTYSKPILLSHFLVLTMLLNHLRIVLLFRIVFICLFALLLLLDYCSLCDPCFFSCYHIPKYESLFSSVVSKMSLMLGYLFMAHMRDCATLLLIVGGERFLNYDTQRCIGRRKTKEEQIRE